MNEARGRSQWLRGVLDLCTLAVLEDGEQHGYGLAAKLERAGFGSVKGGTLYPMLARLEGEGLVSSRWEPGEAGPARKYYTITDSGRAHLAERGASWLRFARNVSDLVGDAVEGEGYEPARVSGPTDVEHAPQRLPSGQDP